MRIEDYHFVNDDRTPFFWLADTAWNAALRGGEEDWEHYLSSRAKQGFTVIQFVAAQWRGCSQPIHGRPFDVVEGEVVFNGTALQKLDRFVDLLNAHGMVAAPIMLWAIGEGDPGFDWPEEHCIAAARHLLERWGNKEIVWLLAGDGNYTTPEKYERWKRIGRAVFAAAPDAIVSMHPCGTTWVGDIFADEPWYSFAGIQSGHGAREHDLQFLLRGDYAKAWQHSRKPFVNLEPNYEDATPYGTDGCFTEFHVRRASYWSLLKAPVAGITYGCNSIWIWSQSAGEPAEGHPSIWLGQPWRDRLETPGIESLKILKRFFDALPWTELRPAAEMLAAQPGDADLTRELAIAATANADCVVAYIPAGDELRLNRLPAEHKVQWVNPRTGAWGEQEEFTTTATPPNEQDWLAVLKRC